MACGLPIVYSDYSGHAELASRGSVGLPVGGIMQPEPGSGILRIIADPMEAVQQIRSLYNDPALGRGLGANGVSFVKAFSKPVIAKRWRAIFRNAVGHP
jgi:glycosyltransferase involved in cell wall biosynthesis